jgi:hypothetical protein
MTVVVAAVAAVAAEVRYCVLKLVCIVRFCNILSRYVNFSSL